MIRRIVYALGAIVVVCLAFQFFFRFQYVENGRGFVWRVDRLTGKWCEIRFCDYYWSLGIRATAGSTTVFRTATPPDGFIPDKTPPPTAAPVNHAQTDANDWGADDPRAKPPALPVTPGP